MQYKYQEDNIPETIATVILENKKQNKKDRIGYRDIHRRVEKILDHRLSFRQFDRHLENMVNEDLLDRLDPTEGKRGGRVYFSLTVKAKRKYNLKLLGTEEKIKKRKNLYQLLISFEVFKRRDLMTERQLNRFLRQIGTSQNDLEEIRKSNASIVFKPVKGVEIVRWIQNNSKMDSLKAASYYIVIPGFTVKEFILYLKKLKEGKDPRPFSSYHGITNVPFVSYRHYTEEEVIQAIDSFRKEDGLIKPINNVFPGEVRFDIADESLKGFIKDVCLVHDIDFRLLDERLAHNGKPKDEDRNYLALLYGEKNVDKILTHTYPIRKSYKEEDMAHKEKKKIAKKFIQDLENYRRSLVQDIIKKHEKIIEAYEIPSELIEGFCFSSFIPQNSSQN